MPTRLCAGEAASVSLFWNLLSHGADGFFKKCTPKEGHEGAQQVARALRWHSPTEPGVRQSREVRGRVW